MKKLLTLFAFPTLLCLMPLKAWAETILNIVSQNAKILRTSNLYVGEVVLDGQQSFYYMYSEDLTNSEDVFGGVKTSLSVFKDGLYSALVPDIVGKTEELGIAVCSNSAYESMMNTDWTSAENAGQACLPNTTVTSASSENLYETNPDFAAKCIGDFEGVTIVDEWGQSMAINGILGKLSATNTDYVTYTVENGVLIKYIERHIDYTCELITVIYTKVELSSGSTSSVLGDVDGDGAVSVTDVAMIVNHILGVNDDNFIIANADINGDGEIDINDVMGTVSIILGDDGGNNPGIGDTSQAYLTCPDDNHPHMIDLGLPSGTLWACCNVADDLSKQSPTYYGGYYAWGETSEKDEYNPITYQYATGVDEDGDGYFDDWHEDTRTYGLWQNIGEDIAGTKYDVAHVKWGGRWRMPTMEQIKELIDNCTSERTFVYGYIDGRYFKNNGGSIFMRGTGQFFGKKPDAWGNYAYYRSSTQLNYIRAYGLYFCNEDNAKIQDNLYSYDGYTVRPVWVP